MASSRIIPNKSSTADVNSTGVWVEFPTGVDSVQVYCRQGSDDVHIYSALTESAARAAAVVGSSVTAVSGLKSGLSFTLAGGLAQNLRKDQSNPYGVNHTGFLLICSAGEFGSVVINPSDEH